MDRMSMQDARFFYLEDDNVLLHIGACAVLEGPPPTYSEFLALTESKLSEVPRFRQAPLEVPWSLGRPVWADHVSFSAQEHVNEMVVADPGDEPVLHAAVARIMEGKLDRSRPLWDSTLVTGLEGDRWAVVIRAHHSMVDGVSGAELLKGILDIDPDAVVPEPEPWNPAPPPSENKLVIDAVGDLAGQAVSTVGSVASLLGHPRETAAELGDVDAIRAAGEKFTGGQTSALHGPVGPGRRWSHIEVDLEQVKQVKEHHGCKVNDVVLAAVTGGFRSLLSSRGVELEGLTLRTVVPLSTHDDGGATPENHATSLIIELPVGLAEPLEWLDFVVGQMQQVKASSGSRVGGLIGDIGDLVYSGPVAVASGSLMSLLQKAPNVAIGTVTTNIAGPQFPLYCLGRRVEGLHPFVPVLHGIPIAVAVLSYDGHLSFGLTADASVTDLGVLAEGITDSMSELAEAVADRG